MNTQLCNMLTWSQSNPVKEKEKYCWVIKILGVSSDASVLKTRRGSLVDDKPSPDELHHFAQLTIIWRTLDVWLALPTFLAMLVKTVYMLKSIEDFLSYVS